MKLLLVKFSNIILGENTSRGPNHQYTEREIIELADQIVENDYWDPPDAADLGNGKFELTAGFHRYHSALYLDQQGKLPEIAGEKQSIRILAYERNPFQKAKHNATENISRTNLTPYQLAHTLQNLHENHQCDVENLSTSFGIDKQTVRNYLRLSRNLCSTVKKAWRNCENTPRAIPLVKLLRWATLESDQQEKAFLSSDWATGKFKIKTRRRKTLRTYEEIEVALIECLNLDIIHALEWVLCRKENLDDGHEYGSNANGRTTNRYGDDSRRSSGVFNHRSMRENSSRRDDSTISTNSGTNGSRRKTSEGSSTLGNAAPLVETTSPIKRKNRHT